MKIPLGSNQLFAFNGAAVGLGKGLKQAASAVVVAGGSGYSVGDLLLDGTGTPAGRAWQFRVLSVDVNGAVLTVALDIPGNYLAANIPANPASPTAGTRCGGTGCTLTVTYLADKVPYGSTWAEIILTGGNARLRDDGGTPTSTVGQLLQSATSSTDEAKPFVLASPPAKASVIAVDGSGILNVTFYGTRSAQTWCA